MTADDLDRHAWAADVALALAALPVAQADTLKLIYFHRLGERDVAARMGVALTHVRAATAAGLHNLGHTLQTAART